MKRLGLWDQYQAELKERTSAGLSRTKADEILVPKFEALAAQGKVGVYGATPVNPPIPPPTTADFEVDLLRDMKWVYANLARLPDFAREAPSQGCEAIWTWAKEDPKGFIREFIRLSPSKEVNDRAGEPKAIDDLLRALIQAESNAIPVHGRVDHGVLPAGSERPAKERRVPDESADESAA